MAQRETGNLGVDRGHLTVGTSEDDDQRAYWLSKSPAERLAALELMRQIIFGYDPLSTRLQRVLTVTRR